MNLQDLIRYRAMKGSGGSGGQAILAFADKNIIRSMSSGSYTINSPTSITVAWASDATAKIEFKTKITIEAADVGKCYMLSYTRTSESDSPKFRIGVNTPTGSDTGTYYNGAYRIQESDIGKVLAVQIMTGAANTSVTLSDVLVDLVIDGDNLADLAEFAKNSKLTVNGGVISGRIIDFKDTDIRYKFLQEVPSGTKTYLFCQYYSGQEAGTTGGLVFRFAYKDSDDYANIETAFNEYNTWTYINKNYTAPTNGDGFKFGWNASYTSVIHIKNLTYVIV